MSPWNLVASLSCNHSPRTLVDFVLPQKLQVKDLICFTESGKGCVQESRKPNPMLYRGGTEVLGGERGLAPGQRGAVENAL